MDRQLIVTFRGWKNDLLDGISWLQSRFIKRFHSVKQILLRLFLLHSYREASSSPLNMITVILYRNNFTVRTFRIGENDFLLGLNMAQLRSIELLDSLEYGLLSFLRRHL
jgi:hypothetical protein